MKAKFEPDYKIFEIKGSSMEPLFFAGDMVAMLDFKMSMIKPMDIICLQTDDGKVVVHRYLMKGKYKGDNLKRYDQEYGTALTPIGKVIGLIRGNDFFKDTEFNPSWAKPLFGLFSMINHADNPVVHRFGVWFNRILIVFVERYMRVKNGSM